MAGYIKLHRDFFNHHLWSRKGPKSRAEAWIDLLQSAAWKDHFVWIKDKNIFIKRGEVPHSLRVLGRRWGWSPMKVNRFISALKTETMIDTRTEQGIRFLIIVNYDTYQGDDLQTGQQAGQQTGQRRDSNETATRQTEEGKEGKETSPLTPQGEMGGEIELILKDWEGLRDKQGLISIRDKRTLKGAAAIAKLKLSDKQLRQGIAAFVADQERESWGLGFLAENISRYVKPERKPKILSFDKLQGTCPKCKAIVYGPVSSGPSAISVFNVKCKCGEVVATVRKSKNTDALNCLGG